LIEHEISVVTNKTTPSDTNSRSWKINNWKSCR